MCGILGVCGSFEFDRVERVFDSSRDTLFHRGPDSGGTFKASDRTVIFGHRRLSILDLSSAGSQPMTAFGLTVTFNGEIYNHEELRDMLSRRGYEFGSNTDTEVLLAAYKEWGMECLEKLNGMFAFGLYDPANQKIVLARDRVGEKPLYYYFGGTFLMFASEIKALLRFDLIPRRISNSAFLEFMEIGYVGGDHTLAQGVFKLRGGHSLVYDIRSNRSQQSRYWTLPDSVEYITDQQQVLRELDEMVSDSVKMQLQADVPVGVLLSGGVDSSLITAYASECVPKVNTYTVTFKQYQRFDESKHASLIARNFATNHTELDAGTISPDIMELMARQFDEPIADSSMIPTYMVSKLLKEHCTVGLGGDGGDELFGGYYHYSRLLRISRMRLLDNRMGAYFSKAIMQLTPVGLKGRNYINLLSLPAQARIRSVNTQYFNKEAVKLYPSLTYPKNTGDDRLPSNPMSELCLLDAAMRYDFQNYLCEDILVKVDRASMLASLELRAPLLDYRIVNYSFSRISPDMKATTKSRKMLLKALLAKKLGRTEFDFNRKQGFSLPIALWLKAGAWNDYANEIFECSDDALDKSYALHMLKLHRSGFCNNSERIYMIMLFELWRREYGFEFV